jgi:hypothetical protein
MVTTTNCSQHDQQAAARESDRGTEPPAKVICPFNDDATFPGAVALREFKDTVKASSFYNRETSRR